MKTFLRRTALASIAIIFLLGGSTAAFADSGDHSQSSRTLSATMTGQVLSLGTQTYTVGGGQVAYAYVGGQPVNAATIKYNYYATQDGFTTKGFAHLDFSGTAADGTSVAVSGDFTISSVVPAMAIPIGCTTTCTSELPERPTDARRRDTDRP
jgi:hypothetical protein